MKRILVLGSLNIDLVQGVPRLPVPGETLEGGALAMFAGGKGANQACAAAKCGGDVRMLGKVGNDVFAGRLLAELRNAGVRTDLVQTSGEPSGTAVIFVLPNGNNSIVISAGANADIPDDFALSAIDNMQEGDILLCQLETPLHAVIAALQAAHNKGMVTVLDPAPARALPDSALAHVSVLTPNQTEAASLLEWQASPETFEEAAAAARALQSRGGQSVIVKMGAAGCWVADGRNAFRAAGHPVNAVDTTAAGDTFNGAFAAALARGSSMQEAVCFANAAAALSVTRAGAIASIPNLQAVEQFLSAST